MAELFAPMDYQVSAIGTIVNAGTTPSAPTDGVDVSKWRAGLAYQNSAIVILLEGDGTARSLTTPTGGAGGAELWTYRKDASGVMKWWLLAYLNGAVAVPIPAAGGRALDQTSLAIGDRLCVAATNAAGVVTYAFVPVEKSVGI